MTQLTGCVLSPAVDVVFGRWTAPILWALRGGRSMRLTQLQNELGGVSPKVLTQRLRQLEVDGLVTRTYCAEMPPRVEYASTPLADTPNRCSPLIGEPPNQVLALPADTAVAEAALRVRISSSSCPRWRPTEWTTICACSSTGQAAYDERQASEGSS